jgi:hypothetical protein
VEERDSQLLQPEPPRKGVCGACVARGWRKHPQIRRAPHNLSTLYQTKHSILRPCCLSCKIYSLFRYESTTPYFLDKCTAAFAVNNHLPQSGKASCRPWSSQNDHPGHISSLFHTHTHTSNMIFPHQCISTCICVNSSCQSTYTFKLPTPR